MIHGRFRFVKVFLLLYVFVNLGCIIKNSATDFLFVDFSTLHHFYYSRIRHMQYPIQFLACIILRLFYFSSLILGTTFIYHNVSTRFYSTTFNEASISPNISNPFIIFLSAKVIEKSQLYICSIGNIGWGSFYPWFAKFTMSSF